MEQSSNGDQSFLPELFSAEELEVSEILLQLPQLIVENFHLRTGFSWGATRKRSVLDSTQPRVSFSSSPLPFVLGPGLSEPKLESESPPMATNKIVALSPATPLAFLPSESDENPKSTKKRSALKKKKEELVGFVDGLTQRRNLLKGELENVKDYYDKLKTFNLKLHARKQKINADLERVKIESEFENMKVESSPANFIDYPPSSNKDRTSHSQRSQQNEAFHYPCNETSSSISGLGTKELSLSPLGIPDLNISLDESNCDDLPQPLALDMSRAMAAQARRKRIQINRTKNSAANKPRLTSR